MICVCASAGPADQSHRYQQQTDYLTVVQTTNSQRTRGALCTCCQVTDQLSYKECFMCYVEDHNSPQSGEHTPCDILHSECSSYKCSDHIRDHPRTAQQDFATPRQAMINSMCEIQRTTDGSAAGRKTHAPSVIMYLPRV